VTLWAETNGSGLVASSGVTNVTGNAESRVFTFNRDISKCGISATLNEGPAIVVYAETDRIAQSNRHEDRDRRRKKSGVRRSGSVGQLLARPGGRDKGVIAGDLTY
jgi:hypothetical protein